MSQATRSPGVNVPHSDKMICVECFRTKGDGDLKVPCQNPRCHFYICSPARKELFHDTPVSFNKEVGHDRKTKPRLNLGHLPNCQGVGQISKSKMWGYQPLSQAHLSIPQVMAQKIRSKSVTSASIGGNMSIQKILSGCCQTPLTDMSKDGDKSRLFHSRMMSLPECSDPLLVRDGGELVEDAFLSSPLADYGERIEEEKHRFGTPDTDIDSGISSPFGRSAMIDWLDCPSSKSQPAPAVSSSAVTSYTFDMSQLKKEMTNSEVEQSLAANGRGSPDAFDPLKLNVTTALGLEGLIQSSETYSRKVFIGGLPPDIDEDDIRLFFMRFGSLTVDWPHKNHSKACIPPKGYAFLLFKNESSVHKLLLSCISDGDKYFIYVPSSNLTRKKVQIRPWYIADSYHSVDLSKPIDPRKAVFVGGVPRPLKASELAEVMTEKYGNVALIVIDSDSDLKYPKGAACVVFSSHASYIAAVSARFMQLNYGSLDKKIEIKPYVLDGQVCDECSGVQCSGKPAPFFCGSVTCLQYYCEYCWATVHSMPGRQNHRPLLKDIGDKARFY